MVRPLSLALCALLAALPAYATDWRAAGGGLFPGVSVSAEPAANAAIALSEPGRPLAPAIDRQPMAPLIAEVARDTGLDPKLLHALVLVESGYAVRAVSHAGAMGLTQLMPGTAAELGVRNAFDAEENLRGGARYLAAQLARFGDLRLALAAYNAGPARVARLGRVPAITETQTYVRDAVECYLALSAGRPVASRRHCRSNIQAEGDR